MIRACFAGESAQYVCSGSEDANLYVWNRASGELLQVLKGHSASVNSVEWTPCHGGMIVSASDDHTLRLWSFADFK